MSNEFISLRMAMALCAMQSSMTSKILSTINGSVRDVGVNVLILFGVADNSLDVISDFRYHTIQSLGTTGGSV